MTGLPSTGAGYVLPLDADDCLVPGALGAMADMLDADPEAAACCGDYLEFGDWHLVRAVPPGLNRYESHARTSTRSPRSSGARFSRR
jgi:hypothetical protein